MITVSAEQLRAKAQVGESDYDFYRCEKCGHLITRIDEIRAFTAGTKTHGRICECGCRKYRPVNMPWWAWFLPKVWRFAWLRIRGIV